MQALDRKNAINTVARLVMKIEHERQRSGSSKASPDLAKIKQFVIDWENELFSNFGGDRRQYMDRLSAKRRLLETNLASESRKPNAPQVADPEKEAKRYFTECKVIAKVMGMVCPSESDTDLRRELVDLCRGISKNSDVHQLKESLVQLHKKLVPRGLEAAKILGVDMDQLVEIDADPLGILNQMVKMHGTKRFANKAKRISSVIGGKFSLCG